MDQILSSGPVTLRRFESSDLDDNIFITELSHYHDGKYTQNQIREYLKELNNNFGYNLDNNLFFIIELDKRPSGIILLNNFKDLGTFQNSISKYKDINFSGEIGIFIIREFRGLGFMSDSLRLFLKYCFDDGRFSKIVSFVNKRNKSSLSLFKRIGFLKVGFRPFLSNHKFVLTEKIFRKKEKNNIHEHLESYFALEP